MVLIKNVKFGLFLPQNKTKKKCVKKFKKSKNCHFSKGVNPWFRSKMGNFFHLFFLGIIGQENVFNYILERKNAFLGYKKKMFNKSKN